MDQRIEEVHTNLKIAELTAQVVASNLNGKAWDQNALASTFRTLYTTVSELVLGNKP